MDNDRRWGVGRGVALGLIVGLLVGGGGAAGYFLTKLTDAEQKVVELERRAAEAEREYAMITDVVTKGTNVKNIKVGMPMNEVIATLGKEYVTLQTGIRPAILIWQLHDFPLSHELGVRVEFDQDGRVADIRLHKLP